MIDSNFKFCFISFIGPIGLVFKRGNYKSKITLGKREGPKGIRERWAPGLYWRLLNLDKNMQIKTNLQLFYRYSFNVLEYEAQI